MKNDLQRFFDRIGKRIYRDKVECSCKDCDRINNTGLEVMNEDHAYYLNTVSMEIGVEYFDKPI